MKAILKDFSSPDHDILIEDYGFETLSLNFVLEHSPISIHSDEHGYKQVLAKTLVINEGLFSKQSGTLAFPTVKVTQNGSQILLSCTCPEEETRLCEHQSEVLLAILKNKDLLLFFDEKLRLEKLKRFAADYGLENESDLESFFEIGYQQKKLIIKPKLPGLLPANKEGLNILKDLLVRETADEAPHLSEEETLTGVIFKQHKYYKNLLVEIFQAKLTKDGKIKNPLSFISPRDVIWASEDHQELKFFTGVGAFQNVLENKPDAKDIKALQAIINNPLSYSFYFHNSEVSEKLTAASLVPVSVKTLSNKIVLRVSRKEQFYELSLSIQIGEREIELKELDIKFSYFLLLNNEMFLVDNLQLLALIDLLKKKAENLLVHASQYKEFKRQLLEKLEEKISIDYQYIKPATPEQLEQYETEHSIEKIIYLSDFGSQVMILPVMRYGEAEIQVCSQRQVYQLDRKGNEFMIYRDYHEEITFTALLIKQHPFFEEQLTNGLQYFYLHKKRFLEEEWFLNAFEEWERNDITILGFNEISGNKLNPNKAKITIHVISGINWFNTVINVRFGKKKAALKNIHRAIRNKTKFVRLDDGTEGILPEEWLEKFTNYFNAGEVVDDETIQTPKSNFSAIEKYYEEKLWSEEVKNEISLYRKKVGDFDQINPVEIPEGLKASLRPYQKKGLDWLNFLDDFNFGGCLADDMGLGKSLQIIAFILSQRKKVEKNVNLLIVPTSLVFNWKAEVAKFAPSIRIKTVYGPDRKKGAADWDKHEIILTTYGTLLSDITLFKSYKFNYIFADESQNIKNPESQRYKAIRTLSSRNKITITGTPIENNTFDLYGQLSFACPGLLGSKQYFRDIYSTPIDRFKDNRRAMELQHIIKPFILRRTKQQVVAELPDKTEMVLYCTMKAEQQKIYDAYEKEFREFISATDNEELKKSPMNVLKGLTILRQICDSPLLLSDRKLTGESSAKIDTLIEQIENKRSDHKILVFSQFVGMLDLIKKELIDREISFSYLTGKTTKREEVINEFQDNPDIRVFLISLKAGGTGLNLTAADYVYLVDPWWNPAVENQAIDRCHRIGQDKHIVAVRLICEGTVEEKILKLQESKRALMKDLIKPDGAFVKSFSKEELLRILGA
ncbi:MAG: DEAD/DEAH box helicase [Daejeonella sp.]|uniref:DEAD/DEAH box helicase n=1 Tax=Daejeonella sp. TaxID=2805397 RepID=UPI003C7280C6